MVTHKNGVTTNVLSPLVESAVRNLSLGYPAAEPNASMELKLRVYEELAEEAEDCFRRRHTRECGEDLRNMVTKYRNAVNTSTSRAVIEGMESALADAADYIADVLNEGRTAVDA